jgi:hypothetical protein
MPKIKFLILPLVLVGYYLLYVATSVDKFGSCIDDCQKVHEFSQSLSSSRDYVYGAHRCTNVAVSDTLCVIVKDTSGINWNQLAHTACTLATQKGLLQQKLFFIRIVNSLPDTILIKQCP